MHCFYIKFFNSKSIDPLRLLAKIKEILEPIVNDAIEIIQLVYPKNKVEITKLDSQCQLNRSKNRNNKVS